LADAASGGNAIEPDSNVFKVDFAKNPKQDLVITIDNPEKNPLIISGGGLQCRNPNNAVMVPLEVTAYRFECMRCNSYSSCALKAETSAPIPQTGCALETGGALYQIGSGKGARFVASLDPGASPPPHVECRMNLSTNQGEKNVSFEIVYATPSPK
jgi:hypothetical protein